MNNIRNSFFGYPHKTIKNILRLWHSNIIKASILNTHPAQTCTRRQTWTYRWHITGGSVPMMPLFVGGAMGFPTREGLHPRILWALTWLNGWSNEEWWRMDMAFVRKWQPFISPRVMFWYPKNAWCEMLYPIIFDILDDPPTGVQPRCASLGNGCSQGPRAWLDWGLINCWSSWSVQWPCNRNRWIGGTFHL